MARPPSVLVVEDESSLLDLLVLALGERAGYPVIRAADGAEALLRAAEERPGVVILDLNLPRLDGYEVARRLRADPATAHAWIIAISGLGHADAALAAGCDEFLWKPLHIDELEVAVDAGLLRAGNRAGARPPPRADGAAAPVAPPIEGEPALAAAAAALLARIGGTVEPLERVASWFDSHAEALQHDAGIELRAVVQSALAVCWSAHHRHLSDADARARLLSLAARLGHAPSG